NSNDFLTGNSEVNHISAGLGADTIEGGGGADIIDGRGTHGVFSPNFEPTTPDGDTATYLHSPGAVQVNLATGENHGFDAEGDTLLNISNVTGSNFDDTLNGDSNANVLSGGAGSDLLQGGGGKDTFIGGNGPSTDVDIVTFEDAQHGVTAD